MTSAYKIFHMHQCNSDGNMCILFYIDRNDGAIGTFMTLNPLHEKLMFDSGPIYILHIGVGKGARQRSKIKTFDGNPANKEFKFAFSATMMSHAHDI